MSIHHLYYTSIFNDHYFVSYILPYRYIVEMAENIDQRLPENLFVNRMIERATIIGDHLKHNEKTCPLIIVANVRPTVAIFKFYDTTEEDDSLKLRMTLSNLGDLDEQLRVLWQQVNFLLQQYCTECGKCDTNSTSNSHKAI